MVKKDDHLEIYGGINQMQRMSLASIKTIGLLPAKEAVTKYHIYLATVVLTGGPFSTAGRTPQAPQVGAVTIISPLAFSSAEAYA